MDPKIRVETGEKIAWYVCVAIFAAIVVGYFLKGCGYWTGF